MLEDKGALLQLLTFADPWTVCRFSRTCWFAKHFVDQHIRFLPRIEVDIKLSVSLQTVEYSAKLVKKNYVNAAGCDDTRNCFQNSDISCKRISDLLKALRQWKYTCTSTAQINLFRKGQIATWISLLEATGQLEARRYECCWTTDDEPDSNLLLINSSSLQVVLRTVELFGSIMRAEHDSDYCNYVAELLYTVGTASGCSGNVMRYNVGQRAENSSLLFEAIVKFLKEFAAKPKEMEKIRFPIKLSPETALFEELHRDIIGQLFKHGILDLYKVDFTDHEVITLTLKQNQSTFYIRRMPKYRNPNFLWHEFSNCQHDNPSFSFAFDFFDTGQGVAQTTEFWHIGFPTYCRKRKSPFPLMHFN